MINIKKLTVTIPRFKLKNDNFDDNELPKVEITSDSLLESEFYESATHLIYKLLNF